MNTFSKAQRGFTIVEVLVAMVVLSVGMLGIAGLYVTTLRSIGGAIYRQQAVNFAADMADRIRVNRTANIAYAGAAANNNCTGAAAVVNCTPAQMAADDLFGWSAQVAAGLPSGAGAVTVAGAAVPYTYTITVSWNDPEQTILQSYAVTMQL
jgi:type IV pilus assembly protein PilV